MQNKEIIDWRIHAMTTLMSDLPALFPGGPSHKAGSPIYLSHLIKSKKHKYLGFITPSVVALSLNISFVSSINAKEIYQLIKFEDSIGPKGNQKKVANEYIKSLFDYFENCMVSVVFSFQAIESFCNSVLSEDPNKIFKVNYRGKIINKRAFEIERDSSTEEKLSEIIPQELNISIPKTDKLWQKFIDLKFVRDSTVHFKSNDMFSKIENIDDNSLFYLFIKNDPIIYPTSAFEIINYFTKSLGPTPWKSHIYELISKKQIRVNSY